MEWSCCLAEDADARGCIEEHSVGVKSTLGLIKNSFKNYVPVKPQHAWKEASYNNSQLLNSSSKLDLATYKKSSVERIRSACSSSHHHQNQHNHSQHGHSQHNYTHSHSHHQHSHHGHNHSLHDNFGNKMHDTPSSSQSNSLMNSQSHNNLHSKSNHSHHAEHNHLHTSNNQEIHSKQAEKLDSRRLTYQPSAARELDNEAIMFQTSLFNTSSRDLIGKVRQGSSRNLSGNRPMTSPAGFRLYQHNS
jgi:hypothetical protein